MQIPRALFCAMLFAGVAPAQVCPHPPGVSDVVPGIAGCNDFLAPNPVPFFTLANPLSASQPSLWVWRHVSIPIPQPPAQIVYAFTFYGASRPSTVFSVPLSTFGSGCLLADLPSVDIYPVLWLPQCSDAFAFFSGGFLIPPGILPAGFQFYAQTVYWDFLGSAQRVAASQMIEIVVQP